ncbi:MAG: DUF1802 family protein [Chthoniobacterales bacterium]
MESVGFKEWSLVCDALGRGEQSIILRKGGIAEGRGGFSFRHREFFFFPTFFHEQMEKVRNAPRELPKQNSKVTISLYAIVGETMRVDSMNIAEALAPLHVLTPEVVRERFLYKGRGLNVALVRVFRFERPWILANEARYGGCRSWVDLPEPPSLALEPVIDDRIHLTRQEQFRAACHPGRS